MGKEGKWGGSGDRRVRVTGLVEKGSVFSKGNVLPYSLKGVRNRSFINLH